MAKRKKPVLRVVWDYERDPDLSYLEQWNTPETYKGNEVLDPETKTPLSFEDYMSSYGDYSRHVVLWVRVEEKCAHCGAWETVDSLGNIDFMEWNDWETGTFTPEEACALKGYQGEYSKDVLAEARHVTGSK